MSRRVPYADLVAACAEERFSGYKEECANVAEEVGGLALRGTVEHIFGLEESHKLGVYLRVGMILNRAHPGLGNYMAERVFRSLPDSG
ncbi:MAG TPA: hypothetical protein VNE40_00410 [Candidatus Dormibacteraeota bacterium]|nr:hypothetical protein [Candidatus Dormibacteraeota bacterium]